MAAALGDSAPGGIHHVGSTAIPGLDAKPVIDILVGVESLTASRGCFGALEELQYLYVPYRSAEMHWFCKPSPARRTHHLHLVPVGTPRYDAELAFRDLLRSDPEVSARFPNDREAYTSGKANFIRRCLAAHG